MTNLITEARELCEKATPGPWREKDNSNGIGIYDNHTWGKGLSPFATVEPDEFYNAAFIIRSRIILPELCDALERAEERGQGCEHCRGWDKRCGANYCPMCGKALPIYAGTIGGEIVKKAMREAEE